MAGSQLEKDLTKALERQEFELYYQPKVNLASGNIDGVEALIRWIHLDKGLIPPSDFIPLAEETGLILPLGEWVLRTACEQNKKWQEAGLPSMVMAVNASGRQLDEPNFVETVKLILKETGLAPEFLEIEITENMVMDVHHILPILMELKRIGIRISLDDFGTGYSSLYYLNKFPIDIIKIDQSFVRNCTVDIKEGTIVKAIIAMAHQLKMDVIAEGIETRDHLIFLQQNLCNQGQGYLFSKPVPHLELEQKLGDIKKIASREGIPQEVSRQKWLEDALENARQELRDTIRQQQGMTYKFVEQNGKFIHTLCDGELVYRIGLTPEQIVGKELEDFRPPHDAKRKLQYYRRAWEGEDYVTYEAESNGVWYLSSLRPIRKGGQVIEVIGSAVDITERVNKEKEVSLLAERLAEQERKYQLIADNTDDCIALLDVNGIVQYASPSYTRILGFSMDGSEGKPGFQKVHPDDVSFAKRQFESVIKSRSSTKFECRYNKVDGSYIWVEVTTSPILLPGGEIGHILAVARNITERKVQEDKLRDSEQRYRNLFELSPDAIIVHIGGRIVFANKSAVKLLAAQSVDDLIGYSIFDFIHPDYRSKARERLVYVMEREANTTDLIEEHYVRCDGVEIYIEAIGVRILYKDENAVQLLVRDITARKESERKLIEEKEKLESLLNNAQDAVNIMDLHGNILRVNPAWETLFGWTQEEVIGKLNPILSKEQFDNRLLPLIERITHQEMINPYELTVYHKNGKQFYASASIYPIHNANGHVIAVVGSTRDISDRKEAERKLRESEEKYRLIAENSQDLIGVLDKKGVVIYASPSHETVLGFSPDTYEGQSAFDLVHPDDTLRIQQHYAKTVALRSPTQVEFRYKHARNGWIDVEAFGTPVFSENGELDRFIVVARDITERKKAEEFIRQSEKFALVGQLAAGIAHEIRNPLTAIQGFIQLLQQGSESPLYFDVIMSEIARLNDIVTELLTLAKPQLAQKRNVNPKSLLEHVLRIMDTQALLHNIDIQQEHESNLPCIPCDENKMKEVFINIIQNAIESMPTGGTLTVKVLLHGACSIQFRFIDQGCGISDEHMKHVGEPFYSFKEKGTGLGLMISHRIVQEHGGNIYINSAVNQGTTVDVILPILNRVDE